MARLRDNGGDNPEANQCERGPGLVTRLRPDRLIFATELCDHQAQVSAELTPMRCADAERSLLAVYPLAQSVP